MADSVNKKLDNLDGKIDKLDNRLDSIDITLTAQHKSIEHHIYRTDLAEKRIEILETKNRETLKEVNTRVKPIESHVLRVEGALKLLGLISLLLGIGSVVARLFNLL